MLNSNDLIKPNWPAPNNVHTLQTTRLGGVSLPPYESLNFGIHVNDHPIHVAQNRQLLSQYLPSEPVWLNQVHGVRVLDAAIASCVEDADASIARQKNVVCVTMTADCLPLLLCDQQGTVVAAVHAGWRGLCDGVIEATVKKMAVAHEDILVWLGPAIGPESFEVGDDVRQAFLAHDPNAALAFKRMANKKWMCNLYLLAKQRLNALGVSQIFGASVNEYFCTFQQQRQFFSFRRDQTTGRMASLIWLT